MQTWRWTELLQMLGVTTTDSHTGSPVLTRNVSAFSSQWPLKSFL